MEDPTLDNAEEPVTEDPQQDILMGLQDMRDPEQDYEAMLNPGQPEDQDGGTPAPDEETSSGEEPDMDMKAMMTALGLNPEDLGYGEKQPEDGQPAATQQEETAATQQQEGEPPAPEVPQTPQASPFEPPKVDLKFTRDEYEKALESEEGFSQVLGAKMQEVMNSMWQHQNQALPKQFVQFGLPYFDRMFTSREYAEANPEVVSLVEEFPQAYQTIVQRIYDTNPTAPFNEVLNQSGEMLRRLARKSGAIKGGGKKVSRQPQESGRVAQRQQARTRQQPQQQEDVSPSERIMRGLLQQDQRTNGYQRAVQEEFGIGPL